MTKFFHLFTIFLILSSLMACGSEGGPFAMATSGTAVVGDLAQGSSLVMTDEEFIEISFLTGEELAELADLLDDPLQVLTNSEERNSNGTATAQVTQDFPNRRSIIMESFDLEFVFDNVGLVRFSLNSNVESTGTIFKLNRNNQPFGTHNITLNLIVETAEQNLTYDNVMLASNTATLVLVQPLPILSFQFAGGTKQLQTLALSTVIPASLIVSDFDPN